MKLYNSLTRKKEILSPHTPGKVAMYVCGPTVYDRAHLGHARAAVCFDLIRRYLTYRGFHVTYVSNITDVDDKIINRAKQERITEAELASRIIPEYEKDYAALNILPPDHAPRATEFIPKMVLLIDKLLKKKAAYITEDGIYFDVKTFPKYGELSGKKLDELIAGARVNVDENKKHPADFALWKKEKTGEPSWPGPAGLRGRPGWHIECSAMSMHVLGEQFDIHGGGIDLIFPHHEDEIAQSEMASGTSPFATYWLHNGHVMVNKEKMSKSLGNFFTIKEIFQKYHPLVVRYFLLSTHYRMPIEFSDDLLEQAKQSLSRFHDFMRRLKNYVSTPDIHKNQVKLIEQAEKEFKKALDDDFDISCALGALFELIRKVNTLLDADALMQEDCERIIAAMEKFDTVLGVLNLEEKPDQVIQNLIEERNGARRQKNWKRADEIRTKLEKQGIILEDTKDGTVWKRAL